MIDYKFFEYRTEKCKDMRMSSRFHFHLDAIVVPGSGSGLNA